jgi:hypothetical protein
MIAYQEYKEAYRTDKNVLMGIYRYARSVDNLTPRFYFRDEWIQQGLHDLFDTYYGRAIHGLNLTEALGYSALYGDNFYDFQTIRFDPDQRTPYSYLTRQDPFKMYRIQTVYGKLLEYQLHREGPDYRLVGKNHVQCTAIQKETKCSLPIRWAGDRLHQIIHVKPVMSGLLWQKNLKLWPDWAGQCGYGYSLVPYIQHYGWDDNDLKICARHTAMRFCHDVASSYLRQHGIDSGGLQTAMKEKT